MCFWSFRTLLDFDFEKLCSVSLSHLNVYACLVCGKYFQGRGTNTHAYTHSVEQSHHVFLNLTSLRFYCLPDGYEIIDQSLEDITVRTEHMFMPWLVKLIRPTKTPDSDLPLTQSLNQSIDWLLFLRSSCFSIMWPLIWSVALLRNSFVLYFQYNVKPHFTEAEIRGLDGKNRLAIAYDGSSYLPGVLGLNNIKANDYCNVIFQFDFRCFIRLGF